MLPEKLCTLNTTTRHIIYEFMLKMISCVIFISPSPPKETHRAERWGPDNPTVPNTLAEKETMNKPEIKDAALVRNSVRYPEKIKFFKS
jgi:hypothetical protein